MARFVAPTLAELRRRGIDYRGVLYAGLMLTPDGPRCVEYNARFGDPEAQVVLPRMTTDLAELLAAAAAGDLTPGAHARLRRRRLRHRRPAPARATRSRPAPATSSPASPTPRPTGATVFCAGVAAGPDGTLVTAGGRVLAVTGLGPDRGRRPRATPTPPPAASRGPALHHRTDIAEEASH